MVVTSGSLTHARSSTMTRGQHHAQARANVAALAEEISQLPQASTRAHPCPGHARRARSSCACAKAVRLPGPPAPRLRVQRGGSRAPQQCHHNSGWVAAHCPLDPVGKAGAGANPTSAPAGNACGGGMCICSRNLGWAAMAALNPTRSRNPSGAPLDFCTLTLHIAARPAHTPRYQPTRNVPSPSP